MLKNKTQKEIVKINFVNYIQKNLCNFIAV